MYLKRKQIILAFCASKLEITQVLLTITHLSAFFSKWRVFTHLAAIHPEITRRKIFKKRYKRKELKRYVYIFVQKSCFSQISVTNTCLWFLTDTTLNKSYVNINHIRAYAEASLRGNTISLYCTIIKSNVKPTRINIFIFQIRSSYMYM